ncbi:MAG TPA: VOC family protein [Polyangiales bacterium]
MTYKPEGYTSAAPYLMVNGAAATIEFLKQVFDAEQLRTYARENGQLMHAEVRVDDTVLMFADATGDWPAVPAHVHIYVKDVDQTYRKALAAGATALQEPVQKGDPDKRGGFRDAGGTTWWVATQLG